MATKNRTALSVPNEEATPLVFHPPEDMPQYARTVSVPLDDPSKKPLPKERGYFGAVSWLRAVQAAVGGEIIFALDEALTCQKLFSGRYNEFLIWAYGPDTLAEYNGVVLLGNTVDPADVEHKWGLSFTSFQRTLVDALVFEPVLDRQGITEALADYYYAHGESAEGLVVPSRYQALFQDLLEDAVQYYNT